jgi:hypothetical protein
MKLKLNPNPNGRFYRQGFVTGSRGTERSAFVDALRATGPCWRR